MKYWPLLLTLLLPLTSYGQLALVEGTVASNTGEPLELATVAPKGSGQGAVADAKGRYQLRARVGDTLVLVASFSGFVPQEKIAIVGAGGTTLHFVLAPGVKELEKLDFKLRTDQQAREEAGTIALDPVPLREVPSPFMDFNQAIVTIGMGVVGNNELSSSYAVRGGNFDENLVYVDNIQIYRPFLVRAGQQEGLSFVNPEMVASVEFSSGGWQPKYGDKLSSVMNIQYKKPNRSAGSVMVSLLGASAHFEGSTANGKFTHLTSVRYKSARYLLNTLDVDGQYLPRFTDVQTYLTADLSGKGKPKGNTTLGLLLSYAANDYQVTPESRETKFGTFQQVFRLLVAFAGDESLRYNTAQGGLKLRHRFSPNFTTELIGSAMTTREREYINLEGGYRLCDVNTDFSSPNFNECAITRGLGTNFHFARNALDASIFALESRNDWRPTSNLRIEFGGRVNRESIGDILQEYNFTDSANFVNLTANLDVAHQVDSYRMSAYAQGSWSIDEQQTLTFGTRTNYWTQNGQFLLSPRLQYAFTPRWQKDIVLTAAVGLYHQPPFYRELRGFEGQLNRSLKAQQSMHAILGMDYNFSAWSRPFKFITELYYKNLWDVVPYDVDNVRLRYYANNDATATVVGADFRLSGEFIPGTESWMGLSLLSARENLGFDEQGSIRRPSDQRVTFSMFFQDHFPNNPSIRMHIRTLFGSGLPYGPPNNLRFRNALSAGSSYNRVDLGFSKLITFSADGQAKRQRLDSIWLGLEILNFFGADNNISFTWVSDFNNIQYAVPNSLSQRFFNLRMIVRY
jgi:hypothetical protein